MGFQPLLKRRRPFGRLERAFYHVVQWDEIHMPRHPPQLFRNEVRLPVAIVYAVNHGVLKGDAPSCFPKVPMAGGEQLLHRISPVHRHNFRAGFPVRRMEGDGQRKLKA
ncbi:hypothetical protein SDC9_207031 [bioreactor metagenome]|uniref:Uncharacterized protein n=1 Tax=bioreactor metagenome TaxID=1076179 RepID=A0A645J841_9ZZZZ